MIIVIILLYLMFICLIILFIQVIITIVIFITIFMIIIHNLLVSSSIFFIYPFFISKLYHMYKILLIDTKTLEV